MSFDKYNNMKPWLPKRWLAVSVFGGIVIFLGAGFLADLAIQGMSPDPIAVADTSSPAS